MESAPEWRNIVVEKKRLYEGEDHQSPTTPSSPSSSLSSASSSLQQHFSSPPPHPPVVLSSSLPASISPTSSSSSSPASIPVSAPSAYPAWKQKRKHAHNDLNNLAVSLDDNHSLTAANTRSRSPNTPDHNSNDSFGHSNLLQSPDNMSPISISSSAANADGSSNGEKLIDDDRLIPVHDNPFFVMDGKRMIGQQQPRTDKKDVSGHLDTSNDCNNINSRYEFTNSLDDTDMEYRPGSGFVSRLKDKFASMSSKEDVKVLHPKRSSSFENLLDCRPKAYPFNGGDLRLTDARRKLREGRAVSVENLNHTMDKSSPTSPVSFELKSNKDVKPKPKVPESSSGTGAILPDRDIVIVEKTPTTPLSPPIVETKPQFCTAASIEEQSVDNELPRPNTVSSFRSLFENSKTTPSPTTPSNHEPVTSRGKGKAPIASSKIVTSASSDSISTSSSSLSSEKVKDGDSISINHVHDKGKKVEGSAKKAEVAKPSSFEQLDLSSKDTLSSSRTANAPTSLSTPLTPSSAPSKSPSLDRLSPANHMADSMKLNLTPQDKLLDSESKENAKPVTENGTKKELNNRGLPSILMRKENSDSGELGQVILRKTNSRTLEDDDELKGRITYYPAGLNKPNNAVSSNYPTPKKRQAPKAPTPDNDSKTLRGEDISDYTLDNERVTINDMSPTKRSGTLEPLTPLDLSSITNNDIVEYQEGYIPTKIGPCKIQFIGAAVKLDRSCITKTKTKKHKVCFRDTLSTLYDYPSEEVMLEDYLEEHPEERHLLLDSHGFAEGNAESTDDGSESDDTSPNLNDGMITNMALSSSGGLSTYRSKYQMDYEFGMQLEEHQPPLLPVEEINEVDQLIPADEKELNSWSESSSSDILF